MTFLAAPKLVASLATPEAADADAADVCLHVACGELHTVAVMRGGRLVAWEEGATTDAARIMAAALGQNSKEVA